MFAAPALPTQRRFFAPAVALALTLALLAVGAPTTRQPAVLWAADARIKFLTDTGYDDQAGSLYNVNRQINAQAYIANGYNGAGVDVALIDSGVAPVYGLTTSHKVVYGPDVSFESGQDNLRNLDTFGHGTHMAGIIAGDSDTFEGVAPGATIVSLKAADALGRTNLGQIVASIKWVVRHAHDDGLNIRVLNLSFGAVTATSYRKDDLAYAVERAWSAGIVTVVAAGNEGIYSDGLDTPAFDPFVIAVGADNPHGTTDVSDDNVSSFSSRGDGQRDPDVIAPGKSVVSLRVPGSYLDCEFPTARVGDDYFRGSGTSQAAAVVSGAAALIISQRPGISPDEVKSLLMSTARPIPNASHTAQGSGLIDLQAALSADTPDAHQYWSHSNGSPQGIWASVPDAAGNSWSTASSEGNSWSGNSWTGDGWSGPGWGDGPDGNSWSTGGWEGVSWGRNPKDGRARPTTPPPQNDLDSIDRGGRPTIIPRAAPAISHRSAPTISQRGAPTIVRGHGSLDFDSYGVSWGKKVKKAGENTIVSYTSLECPQWHARWSV
jgi:serine protease AprX